MKQIGVISIWEKHNIDFTHVHTDYVSTSTIDHFMVSPRLLELIDECGPVHRGDNMSRHSPIFLSLKLGKLQKKQEILQPPPRKMPAWDNAKDEELNKYTEQLQKKLQDLQCPESMMHCKDTSCKNKAHSTDRDSTMLDILCAIVETSYTTIPTTGGVVSGPNKDQKKIPGWSSEVEPLRRHSNYCYRAWIAAGKPRKGLIFQAKLDSHAQFRYAVRRVKRASKLHQAEGLFGAAMAGDIELMKEMKRLKTGKGEMDDLAETVDGETGEREIADKFAEVYNELYNSAESKTGMEELHKKANKTRKQ